MIKTLIIKSNFQTIMTKLSTEFLNLDSDGSCFIICKTEYDSNGNVLYDFFDVINYAVSLGYIYVNTIVYPTLNVSKVAFYDNVQYVVWLCKNKTSMVFNKDAIREKHIWKDIEWGKRAKNYNKNGKDPGNVWIPTIDDGKAHITGHLLLTDKEVIERLINMTDARKNNLIIDNPLNSNMIGFNQMPKQTIDKTSLFANIYFGSSENMNQIENRSITTVVTSPPYWNLKDYFKEGQIGQESYKKYINRMSCVWKECYKKLDENGSLWININIRVQDNSVILIPYDIIRECKKIGYKYKGIIIWHKSSGIPSGPKNLSDHHEYVLLFSKCNDFVVSQKEQSAICDYKNSDINNGAFWNINRKAGSVGKKFIHPAIYPNGLVSRILKLASEEKQIVLDPFLGSGTSIISAININRSCIGFEYNEGFKDLMEERFKHEIIGDVNINYFYDDKCNI